MGYSVLLPDTYITWREDPLSESPQIILNRLMRGTATHDGAAIRAAWRDLLNDSSAATPLVCERLFTDAWRDKPVGPSAAYFGILLALLHELDSAVFKDVLARLSRTKLHPLHRRTLDLMELRLADHPVGKIDGRIPVYIAPDVADADKVFAQVLRWSGTPGLDMSKVTRLDVIAFHAELDYLGLYQIDYDGIVLTWPSPHSRVVVRWLKRLQTEQVFYHELGHHSFQHSEGGQVPEQEDEANAYARAMFRKAHPILTFFVRAVLRPIFGFMRRR